MERADKIAALIDHLIEKNGGEFVNLVVFFPHKAEFGPVRKGPTAGTYVQTTFFRTPEDKDPKAANLHFTPDTVGTIYEPIESKIVAPPSAVFGGIK